MMNQITTTMTIIRGDTQPIIRKEERGFAQMMVAWPPQGGGGRHPILINTAASFRVKHVWDRQPTIRKEVAWHPNTAATMVMTRIHMSLFFVKQCIIIYIYISKR
jgi:hypothetical protein